MPKIVGYFDEKNFIDSSDYEMWLKMASINKPLIVNEKFSYFRVHKTNITSRGSIKQMKQMSEISIKYGNFNIFEKIITKIKSSIIIIIYKLLNLFIKN